MGSPELTKMADFAGIALTDRPAGEQWHACRPPPG
jgi:hypothetical protein